MHEVHVRGNSRILEARDSRLLGLAGHQPSQKMEIFSCRERTLAIRQVAVEQDTSILLWILHAWVCVCMEFCNARVHKDIYAHTITPFDEHHNLTHCEPGWKRWMVNFIYIVGGCDWGKCSLKLSLPVISLFQSQACIDRCLDKVYSHHDEILAYSLYAVCWRNWVRGKDRSVTSKSVP